MDKACVLLVVAIGGLTTACAGTTGATTEYAMEYLEYVRELETDGSPLAVGTQQDEAAVERFQALLADFKAPDFRQRVQEVYAANAFFNDTLKTIRGSEAIEDYLAASAEALDTGTVEFLDVVASDGNYYFRWRMTLRFKKLARDRDTVTVGMSHIRFNADGRVVLHQDFWDSSSGLFEHIPGLGWMIRSVKRRL